MYFKKKQLEQEAKFDDYSEYRINEMLTWFDIASVKKIVTNE